MTIKTECLACGATGLYIGFAEPKGEAVVCVQCEGTGCEELHYKPFKERKPKLGVKTVRRSRGSFVGTGVGGYGGGISYSEFARGKLP